MSMQFYLPLMALLCLCLSNTDPVAPVSEEIAIKWYSLEEAQAANLKESKNFLINLYSDRCVWHVSKDSSSFQSKEVIQYINKHFYPVKFNVEAHNIKWKGKTYPLLRKNGRKVNMLAYLLLNGEQIYPSLVLVNSNYQRVGTIKGYTSPEEVLDALQFTVNAAYKVVELDKYEAAIDFNKD